MNITIIILATVVVLLIFLLYYYFSPTNTLVRYASLSASNSAITLAKPSNSMYTYGFLLYLADKRRSGKIIDTPTFKINLTSTMALQCVSKSSSSNFVFTIMDSIPMSEWTYVTISANNKVMDFYINGKLVSSNVISIASTSINTVTLGSGINGVIQSFTYSATYSAPSEVYDAYIGLNNTTITNNPLTTYTVDVSLIKNGKVADSYVIL